MHGSSEHSELVRIAAAIDLSNLFLVEIRDALRTIVASQDRAEAWSRERAAAYESIRNEGEST